MSNGISHNETEVGGVPIDPREMTSRAIRSVWETMIGEARAPLEPLPDRLPPDLIGFAAAKGSLGPLIRSLGRWELMGLLPEGEKRRADLSLTRMQMATAAMRQELAQVLSACAHEGIGVVVFKGHDVITTCYRDDAIRPVTDADVLVRREDYPKVSRILTNAGYRTPGGEGTCVWSRGGLIIDVHFEFVSDVRNPMNAHLPRIPSVDIFERATERDIGGASYLSPDPRHTLVITALHALTHSYLMDYWFMDSGVLVITNGGESFAEGCLATAERYRLEHVLQLLFWAMRDLFAFPLDVHLPAGYRPSSVVRRLIRSAVGSTRYLFFGDVLLGLSIDSNRKKFYYFKEMAFPHKDIIAREAGIDAHGAAGLYLSRSIHLIRSGFRALVRGG